MGLLSSQRHFIDLLGQLMFILDDHFISLLELFKTIASQSSITPSLGLYKSKRNIISLGWQNSAVFPSIEL